MRIIKKSEFKNMLEDETKIYGGIVFADYKPDIILSDVMITEYRDSGFGATNIIPVEGEVFFWDWSIDDYEDNAIFIIFDNNDILMMIKTLASCIEIPLKWE